MTIRTIDAPTAPGTAPTGAMLIAGDDATGTGEVIYSVDPRTGARLTPGYPTAGQSQVARACAAAAAAFPIYRSLTVERRAGFLDQIATSLDELRTELVERAHAETGLPVPRLTGEVGRTTSQLRAFARELRAGVWQGVRVDTAQPNRAPAPRPDIRQRRVPVGPVAVFGASNFPLAFSTAGGDTASALAAGCPVVVKAHPAHLGTAEIVARAVSAAVAATGLPAGVFSQVVGGAEVGIQLVSDQRIRAVAFTGSRQGGLALAAAAAAREVPIPVFAEMSSINPVLLLPGALAGRGAELGRAFADSLMLGAGQFCTNPGLVLAIDGPGLDLFVTAATEAIDADSGATMLTTGIASSYRAAVDRLADHPAVTALANGRAADTAAGAAARLFRVTARDFAADPMLRDEVFGATSLLVVCTDHEDLRATLESLEGQLTATVHADTVDHAAAGELLPTLELLAGRIVFNGWPTGVEVCDAMVHGGPFPATTDGRSTSVGTAAIDRFLRPVAYQGIPDALLPSELTDSAPADVWRRVDGTLVGPSPVSAGRQR